MISEFDKLCNKFLAEEKQKGVDGKACWKGYKRMGTKKKGNKTVDNCVKIKGESIAGPGNHDPFYAEVHHMVRDLFRQKQAAYPDADSESLFDATIEDLESQFRMEGDERALHILNDISLGFGESTIQAEKNATCTGPTKKASSTSKGKKYMKCVKSDSGGYKRIHWGQKGAKAGSGNSKRKKAFRARHKCSSAKSNTPRGQACKDW